MKNYITPPIAADIGAGVDFRQPCYNRECYFVRPAIWDEAGMRNEFTSGCLHA